MVTDGPFVGSDFSPEDFRVIGTILSESGGVALDLYNTACVQRRIAARIRDLKLPGAQPYIEVLCADRDEVQRLSALLSLHVSTFYRDPSTFVALRQLLEPPDSGEAPLRQRCWWSAGCAGGEEPYSLALLAAQSPESFSGVEILASDVSQEILEKARSGFFPAGHLSNIPAEEQARCFVEEGRGYRIGPQFRSKVRFVRLDLLSEESYPLADLILCRYVLIYFNPAEQEQVLCRFAEALPSGGILVLGRTETLRDQRGLFVPINATERIYRRI